MNRKTGAQKGQGPETVDAPSDVGAGNSRSPVTTKEMALAQLWTTEALEAAEPYPIEISEETLKKAKIALKPEAETARAGGSQAGGLPEATEEEKADLIPTATTGGYNYPGPYNRYEVFCYDKFPYITIGKLFFKQLELVCSISSFNRQLCHMDSRTLCTCRRWQVRRLVD